MSASHRVRPTQSTLLVATLMVGAAGCGPSAEQTAELEQLRLENGDLAKQKVRLEKEADQLHAKVTQLQSDNARLEGKLAFARLGIDEGQPLHAAVVTSMGTIDCTLFPQEAPKTVLNFVELAEGTREWTDPATGEKVRRPLYDGTIFHRVIPEFMIQGGDPKGNGTGGPGYKFEDEVDGGRTFDKPGLLAMANSGPDTNGSQFFITDRAKPSHLNGKHTIFGACDDLDTVQAIASVDKDRRDRPKTDVTIQTIRIVR